ncbi:MAG: trypsin-like serine protease [Bdellovibrio sp.]|nr:trypsin-like serine protease [Bdellovibrio sp.]
MNWMLKTAVMVMTASVLAACQGQDISNLNLDGEGIYGGQEVAANDPDLQSVVSVRAHIPEGQVNCTGVLIGNNTVLTAAHCLEPYPQGTFDIAFGRDAFKPNVYFPVKSKVIHDDYKRKDNIDLAVLRFTGKLPAGYKPALLPTDKIHATKFMTVIAAGYGQSRTVGSWSEPDHLGAGILRKISQDITWVQDDQFEFHFNQRDRGGICHGDSGGPVLFKSSGQFYVLGINKRVSPDVSHDDMCRGMSFVQDVYLSLTWVKEQLNK